MYETIERANVLAGPKFKFPLSANHVGQPGVQPLFRTGLGF